jgi:hypothetical protein
VARRAILVPRAAAEGVLNDPIRWPRQHPRATGRPGQRYTAEARAGLPEYAASPVIDATYVPLVAVLPSSHSLRLLRVALSGE